MKKLISKKKPFYPISNILKQYLIEFNRWMEIPISYDDLLRFQGSVVVYDEKDNDTLWSRVYYSDSELKEIDYSLKKLYTILHSDGNESTISYLNIDAIDYCTFGNSKPFRVKVRNILNDNFTYFYIKKTDSSRVFGLEFEHMLSPYNLNFLVNDSTLIEEHVAGIPGDVFIKEMLPKCSESEQSQIAKEYVKFNERCMVRLLGDMRAYNYVIVPIHDFDQVIYRIRAIDFDQQSFEGRFSVYRPQFFKENQPLIKMIQKKLTHDSIDQYKIEERSIVAKRIISNEEKIDQLLASMKESSITIDENLNKLKIEIYKFTNDKAFKESKSMGDIMEASLAFLKRNYKNIKPISFLRN
ncbi:MAG: hypothetical protein CMD32_03845 [Flavobacteriales bacterium]|jgi:hypothetical protein|nr:hypothetical protein [Flavobacteriales bacterium]|tara:strand:+ start:800 stop:1864 length:1065 start_codon:yes stop_codon:yes gene_type:complete